MTTYISPKLVRAMGFEDTSGPELLVAEFSGFTAYEIRGLSLPDGFCRSYDGTAGGIAYKVGISTSLNLACRAIADDDFVEDEAQWKEDRKIVGPFALIQVGPTGTYEAEVNRLRRESDGSVTTYDAFPAAREDVLRREERALPRVVSALSCALNEQGRFVTLRRIERLTAGELTGGATLHDVRLEIRADLRTSASIDAEALEAKLQVAAALTPSLHDRVAKFVALGQGEEDHMKRFLYFFLALEIETHAAFSRIDHGEGLARVLTSSALASPAGSLLSTQVSALRSLYDRFVWCAACVWPHLSPEDVAQFKQLKQARDDIAHGKSSEPPAGYARLAEQLAVRVLSNCVT